MLRNPSPQHRRLRKCLCLLPFSWLAVLMPYCNQIFKSFCDLPQLPASSHRSSNWLDSELSLRRPFFAVFSSTPFASISFLCRSSSSTTCSSKSTSSSTISSTACGVSLYCALPIKLEMVLMVWSSNDSWRSKHSDPDVELGSMSGLCFSRALLDPRP